MPYPRIHRRLQATDQPPLSPLQRQRAPHRPAASRRRIARAVTLATAAIVALGFSSAMMSEANAVIGHNPIGTVDQVTVGNGQVRFQGWAWDPDSANSVRMWIVIDGKLTYTTLAQTARSDVARAYPAAGANRGFSIGFYVPNGTHSVCALAANIGPGANQTFRCTSVTMNNNPFGSFEQVQMAPGGIQVAGWVLDPNTTAPTSAVVSIDGKYAGTLRANLSRPDIANAYPYYGALHGFVGILPVQDGRHSVCVTGTNIGFGVNQQLLCRTVTTQHSPLGNLVSSGRLYGTSDWVGVSGWSFDPDSAGPISVELTSKGVPVATATANSSSPNVAASYPSYGSSHGYSGGLHLNGDQQQICAVAKNVGLGTDSRLGCFWIYSTGTTTPAAPPNLQAWPGSGSVDLTWTAPTSTASPITGYTVLEIPDNRTISVPAGATRATIGGLLNGHNYSFALMATNQLGTGSASWVTTMPTVIPPQFNPAPVSTSHYMRNLGSSAVNNANIGWTMGATDATNDPSGHRYLNLLQVGGQDEANKGALLSATTTFVSYPNVVAALKGYVDGYHSHQRANAPVVIAIGTNNDVDVSMSAGLSWAINVVNPVRAYAARYPNMEIAGADDIEPGFSATSTATGQWLSGFLNGTSARFVFNGSADGCSTIAARSACNNGWSAAVLQYLSGGAAPSRIISLPQIYNYAMPMQWKYISLTGVDMGRPRLYFGGPLTEWTACAQAGGSCGSITNVDAWNRLWSAIASLPATRQYDMPNGTDLRIN